MGKKNKNNKKIDPAADAEGFSHNPFADLLGDADRSELPEGPEPEPKPQQQELTPTQRLQELNKVVLRKERKGRGGKTVTLVQGLDSVPDEAIEELAADMRKAFGTGSTVEGKDIALQGDQRDRVEDWLKKHDIKNVVR